MIGTDSYARGGSLLREHQRLATSGARAAATFTTDGALRLAVPQLALDVAGEPPYMNGGDSNCDLLLYRWQEGCFVEDGRLAVPGGEDAHYFRIGEYEFLATASIRTGAGPYDYNSDSVLFRREAGSWRSFQAIRTFAAKQWHYFSFDGRHFLALAQGVTLPGPIARHPRQSCIYEWDGARFVLLQTLDGGWGYNWVFFEVAQRRLLGYADHTGASGLLEWNGRAFVPFQEFAAQGGRAYKLFRAAGQIFLAFANLTGESQLYRWEGERFVPHQSLGGPGAREFAVAATDHGLYLIKINFIHGTPAAPKTDLMSCIYEWQEDRLVVIEEFPTSGGTDAAAFERDGNWFLVVSNSLSHDIRFREDTVIYRFGG